MVVVVVAVFAVVVVVLTMMRFKTSSDDAVGVCLRLSLQRNDTR